MKTITLLIILSLFFGRVYKISGSSNIESNQFCDNFSETAIGSGWNQLSGTWSINNGSLYGYWSQGAAQTDQGIVLIKPELYDAQNFTATVNVMVRTGYQIGGERFVLRNSAGNQIMISFSWITRGIYPHIRQNSSSYASFKTVENFIHFKNALGDINEYKIIKNGKFVKVFVNGYMATEFEDTYFNGITQLGLATYGTSFYEDFCISDLEQTNSNFALLADLISYWKFDGDLNDVHGVNHGTAGSGVTSLNEAGIVNFSPYFNGASNAYITCGNDNSLNITGNSITISAWIKAQKSTRTDIISKGRDYTSNYGYHIYTLTNPLRIRVQYRLNTGDNIIDSEAINLNEWYHIASTFDGIYGKLYINGDLVQTTEKIGSIGNATTPFTIGAHSPDPTGWGYQWKGNIDEVGIWKKTLTIDEIKALYNSGNGLQYPFDAITEDFWEDHTNGGIAVKVIETGEKGVVTSIGYGYERCLMWEDKLCTHSNEYLIKIPLKDGSGFITDFPKNWDIISKFNNEIILFNAEGKRIGHITYNYNPDTESDQCRHVILFFHNDNDMKTDGTYKYFPFDNENDLSPLAYKNKNWEYFSKGEYPVSMLIPPFDKMPETFDKDPVLFVHGWEGTYPYWKPKDSGDKSSTVDIFNLMNISDMGFFQGWQFYYPGNMDIEHSALCLKNDIEYLSINYYNSNAINVVTHSMGGLVTSEYVTSYPDIAKKYIKKALMTVPPIHGSLGANLLYNTEIGAVSELPFLADNDSDAPCVLDMSIGSNFMNKIHDREWNECFNFENRDISDNVFVLIGTTPKNYPKYKAKAVFAEEAYMHSDVTVAISSASLLDHNIGFATMYGNHDDGRFNSNITDRNFLPNFIYTYFKSGDFYDFATKINNFSDIRTIVDPYKNVLKPIAEGCKLENLNTDLFQYTTGEDDVVYQKGLIWLNLPDCNITPLSVWINEDKKSIGLSHLSYFEIIKDGSLIGVPLIIKDPWFRGRRYFGEFIRNEHSKNYFFRGYKYDNSRGSALKLANGDYTIISHPESNLTVSHSFDFNNCQSFNLSLKSNSNESLTNSQSYFKKAFLTLTSLLKTTTIGLNEQATINDTTFYIDDQIQAVNFTLQSWEANENQVPITMKLKMPDGTVLNPTSAGITFSIDSISGVHQMLINNPMVGKWHIWAESNQPGADTMQYVAKAYFLSDIVAYNACDTNEVVAGKEFACKAGLKFNNLSLLDTTGIKVIATVTSPKGEQQIFDISENIIQTDTSFVFGSLIQPDTMGYYTVEVTFEGSYNGFKFERALIFQFESLDNNVYFNLPSVELNENKTFTELRLSKFIQTNAGNYDSVKFTQRIISTSVDTSAYNVILDSLQQNMVVYSTITDTGMVRIEYAFNNHLDSLMKDTLQVFINQVYPHPKLTVPYSDLCFGESLVLSAFGGDTFQWSTGDTTNTITVSPATTTMYKITVGRNGYFMDDSIQIKVENTPSKITLKSGWNIMSSPGYRQSTKIKSVFQSLIDKSSLLKIQDETGNSLEDWGIFGSWKDNIGDMYPTEGYKTKVSKNDSLEICGTSVQYPFAIPLKSGWNIMGYPQTKAFDGLEVIQQLIDRGKLIKAQDEEGNSIEDWGIFGGWKNNIYDFVPGKGYNIKLSADDTLWITESYTKSSAILPEVAAATHFKTEFEGNGVDHMNIYLVGLPINLLNVGDELAIFDKSTCVGAVTIMPHHLQTQTASIAASSRDNQGLPGFAEGNPVTLKLWASKQNTEFILEPEIVNGTSTFAKLETTIASLEKYSATGLEGIAELEFTEINCYPNPFSDEMTIEIKLVKDSEVQVEVLNQLGQKVRLLQTEKIMNSGVNRLTWDGRNTGNQQFSPGIYHLQIEIDETILHRKIVLSKINK